MFKILPFLHKINEPLPHTFSAIISIEQIRVFVSTIPIKEIVHMHTVNWILEAQKQNQQQPTSELVDSSNSITHELYVSEKHFSCCFLVAMSPSFFQFSSHTRIQYYTSIPKMCMVTCFISSFFFVTMHAKAYACESVSVLRYILRFLFTLVLTSYWIGKHDVWCVCANTGCLKWFGIYFCSEILRNFTFIMIKVNFLP